MSVQPKKIYADEASSEERSFLEECSLAELRDRIRVELLAHFALIGLDPFNSASDQTYTKDLVRARHALQRAEFRASEQQFLARRGRILLSLIPSSIYRREKPNLLVATGTGSGKTESFMLPILNDLLHEAPMWEPVTATERPGRFDPTQGWLHSRRHERRPAAIRGLILYPMNALVNDQLSRLRRILARGHSPTWQKQQWQGNAIHFGMYTGLTLPTGHWSSSSKRRAFFDYLKKLTEDWERLREDLRETGNWPRPDSPEMLCRWDMQLAPPDVLVTNYSMLEYMLARPIEASIFQKTRQWLKNNPDARFTLVLDEAHTYKGALGTEVAYLIRRLKERLGLVSGSSQFRAIATTASVPPGADDQLAAFVADLFGEPQERFTLVRVGSTAEYPTTDSCAHARLLSRYQWYLGLYGPCLSICSTIARRHRIAPCREIVYGPTPLVYVRSQGT